MENQDKPAFPEPYINDPNLALSTMPGLTKREYFAALAMQSMASVVYSGYNEAYKRQLEDWQLKYGQNILVREAMAKDAVELADELLKQLEDGNNKS